MNNYPDHIMNYIKISFSVCLFLFNTSCKAQKKEVFEDFISRFANDTTFQLERINFPLKYDYLEEENFEEVSQQIKKADYKTSRLYYDLIECSEAYTIFYDNFDLELRDSDERVFRWKGFTGMDERYYFKRIDGIWFLVKIESFST